jgi:hypothetical protein
MVHFTCDLCGRDLPSKGGPRYVIKIEIAPARDNDLICEDDLADDNMEAISQILQEIEQNGGDGGHVLQPKNLRYDLCPDCLRRYEKAPLNCGMSLAPIFSKN